MTKEDKSGKMIKVSIYFHTSQGDTKLPPKVAFKKGLVQMPTNHTHGIRSSDVKPVPFSKAQGTLMKAIKTCLEFHGISFVEEGMLNEYKKALKEDFFDKEINL
jgi:hypothetical protein